MATPTLALVAATPYALKYLWTDDGTGGAITKTLAQMITDAKTAGPGPSPLLAFLQAQTDTTFGLLPNSLDLTVATTILDDAASGFAISTKLANTAPTVNTLTVTGHTGTALTATVEVRFHNTYEK